MRWSNPKNGDIRIIKRFLLFPKTVNNVTIWLETAYIKQEYKSFNRLWYNSDWAYQNSSSDKNEYLKS